MFPTMRPLMVWSSRDVKRRIPYLKLLALGRRLSAPSLPGTGRVSPKATGGVFPCESPTRPRLRRVHPPRRRGGMAASALAPVIGDEAAAAHHELGAARPEHAARLGVEVRRAEDHRRHVAH